MPINNEIQILMQVIKTLHRISSDMDLALHDRDDIKRLILKINLMINKCLLDETPLTSSTKEI